MASDPRLPHVPQSKKAVPSDWSWCQLGDACAGVFDCPHSTPNITDAGPLVVRTQDILSGVFRVDQAAHVSDETYLERIGRAEPQFGDLLYSREGTYFGIAAQVPPDQRVCLGQRMVLLRPNPKTVNPRFLCYWLNSPTMARHVAGYRDGSVAERLNLPTIRALPVVLPPLEEQDRISRVLGALDDKIKLNRRMSETLEAMACALFKSWFIDFDPVHAKAEGRDTHLPADIAALFPDSFQDSDLGEIPKGWRAGRLGDVSVSPRRSVRPHEISPETPYVALEHMPRGSIALTEWGDAEGLESSKFQFEKGEILFGKLRPYFHKVGVAPVDGVCSTDIVVLAPCAKDWLGFVLGHASSVAFVEYTNSGSTGTKMPRTSWSEMARYPVALPTEEVAKEFSSKVRSLIDKIVLSVHESHALASLRDALLPKLLSGELRVKDVDDLMEAHV